MSPKTSSDSDVGMIITGWQPADWWQRKATSSYYRLLQKQLARLIQVSQILLVGSTCVYIHDWYSQGVERWWASCVQTKTCTANTRLVSWVGLPTKEQLKQSGCIRMAGDVLLEQLPGWFSLRVLKFTLIRYHWTTIKPIMLGWMGWHEPTDEKSLELKFDRANLVILTCTPECYIHKQCWYCL